MIKLDRLNDKQKEAVLADDNKILLVSAAGSGKTRVLTTKVAYLISEKGVSPSNILALTFTNKAAGEMKERVLKLVGDIDKQDINIMTFHSFGVKALRKFVNRYDDNFNQNFIILDANDTKKLFQKVMREANDYLCDNGIIAPSDLPDEKEWEGYLEVRNDYLTRESKDYIDDIEQEYCERFNSFLEKNNSMTFDDLLIRTYLMFKNYPISLQYYQTLFQYILVDEFQDTDDLQFEILTMLQEKNQRLFAVGDDFQCLPVGTKIKTIDGDKNIEEITTKDKLVVASGRGRTDYSLLEEKYSISSKWYNGPLIKITTESGKQISATPEHIVFANQIIDNSYFVYLMYKEELGFRIGMSKTHHPENRAKNGYESRMTEERADKVWIINTFNTKEEAVLNEQYYAFQYGIPLYVFKESGRRIMLKQDSIEKFFKSIDTFSRGKKLLKDLNMFFEYPNCKFKNKPFLKDEKRPIFKRVTLTLFGRYDRRNDNITHELHYCTVNEDFNNTCEKIYGKKASLKKNVYNTRYYNGHLTNKNSDVLCRLGWKIEELDNETIFIQNARLTNDTTVFEYVPFSNLRKGMTIALFEEGKIITQKIVSVETINYSGYVYDLNIPNYRNYIANDIVVHNCIYSWRRANPEIMLGFDKTFKETKTILMEQNYRSTPEIVELGNAIISYNKHQLKKTVFTENSSGDKPELICVARYQDEARYITYKIQELIRSGYNYSDIAILYRTNSLSRGFEDALLKARIPYRVHNGTGFYSREEIKDMLSFLSLIGNDYDNMAFERIINKPKRKIGAKTIDNLTQSAIENSESNHYSLLKEIPNYKGSGKDKFQLFYDQIVEIRQKYLNKEIKLSGIIKLILEKLDYTSYLDSLQTSEDNDRLGNVYEFATILKEYETQTNLESAEYTLEFINEIVQNITLFTTDIYDEETGEKNVVTLMTMHASKGLEYPIIFLPALEKGIFPNPRGDEEEERRLFYVACTRAEKKIFASYSIERYINGQLNYTTMSPYVNEVLEYFKQK